MIVTSLRNLIFLQNDNKHTVSYCNICKDIANTAPYHLNAVITEEIEDAVKLLRYDIMCYIRGYLMEGMAPESQISIAYTDFNFEIHTTEVTHCRVDIHSWLWDKKTYSLEVTA